jgi:steroid 5-alpha reductase family enzyme
MPDIALLLIGNFAIAIGMMLCLWLVSVIIDDVSFIDAFWAFGLGTMAVASYLRTGLGATDRRLVVLVLTLIWAARLGGYLFWRWRKHGPDKRYLAMTENAVGSKHIFTLIYVFLLQGCLLWLVSLPVQLGALTTATGLGPQAMFGIGLSILGIIFESIGDWQMARFKSDPDNRGKVMDRGLWRYTRHPNYFGDACVWWGLFLIVAERPYGWLALPGPLMLTFLLVQWSGAALLERQLQKTKPEYLDYMQRTSSFIPMPPKRGAQAE